MSEVVLNYEEIDINQCPDDRKLNAFASTALCDSTTECVPLGGYGMNQGGYECHCRSGYHYPPDFEGPYKGIELLNAKLKSYPLCIPSQGLLQFPTWITNDDQHLAFSNSMSDERRLIERRISLNPDWDLTGRFKRSFEFNRTKKSKRFIDRRNNYEKLRDSILETEDYFRGKCLLVPFQDVFNLNDDDERFVLNLRFDSNFY